MSFVLAQKVVIDPVTKRMDAIGLFFEITRCPFRADFSRRTVVTNIRATLKQTRPHRTSQLVERHYVCRSQSG